MTPLGVDFCLSHFYDLTGCFQAEAAIETPA
jgi:hypothetical protein